MTKQDPISEMRVPLSSSLTSGASSPRYAWNGEEEVQAGALSPPVLRVLRSPGLANNGKLST